MKPYDYIVAGAGASGLSLLVHMIRSGQFRNKRILLIDKSSKTNNDRTWCFWERGSGLFDDIVYRSWDKLQVFGEHGQHIQQNVQPYQYKLIRGIDFYNYCFDLIKSQSNIDIVQGDVTEVYSSGNIGVVNLQRHRYEAAYVFNSIRLAGVTPSKHIYYLQQHFRGWFIRAARDVINNSTATLMDFRTSQRHGTTFFYVMPFSQRDALVEYTLFSADLLRDEEYDVALKHYCEEKLGLKENMYEIREVETGSIPMTNFPFKKNDGNVINIGTAGGNTKPSSGYTFRFIQKNSAAIVQQLVKGNFPAVKTGTRRHMFYDSVLLNILSSNKMKGSDIFTRLFQRNSMQKVLKFLDSETSFVEDLELISTLPARTFSLAAMDHMLKNVKKKSSEP